MNSPTISLGARLTAVRLKNQSGEETGKVVEWLMDVEQGRVVYVVAEFNGSHEYYAIPWPLMKADLQAGGYFVDQEQIKRYNLQIDRNQLTDLVSDKDFLNHIFETYQVPKYWEGNQTTAAQQPAEPGSEQKSGDPEAGQAANAQASEGKGYGG